MEKDELNTLVAAYELATFLLDRDLDRLHHIIASGIDVHVKTYTTTIDHLETVKAVLPKLQDCLEELRALRETQIREEEKQG